jgi:hypothetical protein
VAREIDDYQSLQDAVRDWLNRDDLVTRIPTFIYLAERKMFRRYRNPNNEKTITFDMRVDPDAGEPTELTLSNQIAIPPDYLEMLTLQANSIPLKRKSLTEIQSRQVNGGVNADTVQGEPKYFARNRRNIVIWPFPTGDTLVTQIYYCDFTGNMVVGDDDNDVLRTAPDLYLYGSLLQAQPFLKPTDDEWQLIPTWKMMYEDAFGLIEYQRDEDERSGSNVEINSAFGGSTGARVRSNGNS